MPATGRMRPLLIVAVVLCVIGAIDSIVDRSWDQVVLFLGTILFVSAAVVIRHPERRPLTLRADLVAWLRLRSELTGESVETLADRAVAAHRANLTGREEDRR